jgi:hypothetical protein
MFLQIGRIIIFLLFCFLQIKGSLANTHVQTLFQSGLDRISVFDSIRGHHLLIHQGLDNFIQSEAPWQIKGKRSAGAQAKEKDQLDAGCHGFHFCRLLDSVE